MGGDSTSHSQKSSSVASRLIRKSLMLTSSNSPSESFNNSQNREAEENSNYSDVESFVSLTRQAAKSGRQISSSAAGNGQFEESLESHIIGAPKIAARQTSRANEANRSAQIDTSATKFVQLGQLVTRVESCLELKDQCQRLCVELEFLVRELEYFNDVVNEADFNDKRDYTNLAYELEHKCGRFEQKIESVTDLQTSIQPFESSSYNDAIASYQYLLEQWASVKGRFIQENDAPSQKTRIISQCHKKFGEIECFISKNESLLKHIESTDYKNAEANEEFENSIKKMKDKIKAYENEIGLLKNTIESFETLSNQKITSKFQSCTLILEKFKHEIIVQEDSLATASIEIKNYNNFVKCQNSLKMIKQQLEQIKPPTTAPDIEQVIQTVNYLDEAFDKCKESIGSAPDVDPVIKDEDHFKMARDKTNELFETVESRLKNKKSELNDTIGYQKYIEELKTFKDSIEKLIDTNLVDIKTGENVVETESELRKLVIFQTEIRKRLEEIKPTIQLLEKITAENDTLPIIDTLKCEMKLFTDFVDSSDKYLTKTRKNLMTEIDYHKFISQSDLLVHNMDCSSNYLSHMNVAKINKHHRGYKLFFEYLKVLKDFFEAKYRTLKKIYENLVDNDPGVKILDRVRTQNEIVTSSFDTFIDQYSGLFKTIDSVGKYMGFIRDFNYLNHSLDIKNKVGEWMLKCSDDDIAYYHKKASEDFEIIKEKVEEAKNERDKLAKEKIFDDGFLIDISEIETKLNDLYNKQISASNSHKSLNKDLNFMVELDFIFHWINAVINALSFSNPKFVSYSWQLCNEVAESETSIINTYFLDLEKRMMADYKDVPEVVFEKLLSVKEKINDLSERIKNFSGKECYDFFLKLKQLKSALVPFNFNFTIPNEATLEEVKYCQELLLMQSSQLSALQSEFDFIMVHHKKYINSGGPFASMLSTEVKEMLSEYLKISGAFEYNNCILEEFVQFHEKKKELTKVKSKLAYTRATIEQKMKYATNVSKKDYLIKIEIENLKNMEEELKNLKSNLVYLENSISKLSIHSLPWNYKEELKCKLLSNLSKTEFGHQFSLPKGLTANLFPVVHEKETEYKIFVDEIGTFPVGLNDVEKLSSYNQRDSNDSKDLKQEINSMGNFVDNILKTTNDLKLKLDDNLNQLKFLKNIKACHHWLHLNKKNELFKGLPTDSNEFVAFQKEISHFIMEMHQKQKEFDEDCSYLSDASLKDPMIAECRSLFKIIGDKVNTIFKSSGPSHHLNEIITYLDNLHDWIVDFSSRLEGLKLPSEQLKMEYELLNNSHSHLKSIINPLMQEKNLDESVETLLKDCSSRIDDVNSLKDGLEIKLNQKLSENDAIILQKECSELNDISFCQKPKLQKYFDKPLNSTDDMISSYNEGLNNLTELDNKLMKIAALETSLDDAQSNMHCDPKTMNKLLERVDKEKHDTQEMKNNLEDQLAKIKNASNLKFFMRELNDSAAWTDKVIDDFRNRLLSTKDAKNEYPMLQDILSVKRDWLKGSEKKFENFKDSLPGSIASEIEDKMNGLTKKFDEIDCKCDEINSAENRLRGEKEKLKNLVELEQYLEEETKLISQGHPERKNSTTKNQIVEVHDQKSFLKEIYEYIDKIEEKERELPSETDSGENDPLAKELMLVKDKVDNIKLKMKVLEEKVEESEVKLDEQLQLDNIDDTSSKIKHIFDRINSYLTIIDKLDSSSKNYMKKKSLVKFCEDEMKLAQSLKSDLAENFCGTCLKEDEKDEAKSDKNKSGYKDMIIGNLNEEYMCILDKIDAKKEEFKSFEDLRSKIDMSEQLAMWMDEKGSELKNYFLKDPSKQNQTIDIQVSQETFQHFEPEINEILATLSDYQSKPTEKKLGKVCTDKFKKLSNSLKNFIHTLNVVNQSNKCEEILNQLTDMNSDLKKYTNVISNDITQTVSEANVNDALGSDVGIARLENYHKLLTTKHDYAVNKNKALHKEFTDLVSSRSQTSKMETVQSNFKKVDNSIKTLINRCETGLGKWKYQSDCVQMSETLKAANDQLSTVYANFMNTFANMQAVENPHQKLCQLEVTYKPIIGLVYQILNKDLVEFKERAKSHENTELKFNDVAAAEKNLRNLINCYEKDFQKFHSKFSDGVQAIQNITSIEHNFISLSSEFSSLIDSIDTCLDSPIKVAIFENLKFYMELKKTISSQLKQAEQLLDTLSSLSMNLTQTGQQISAQQRFKELETLFLDTDKRFNEYCTNLDAFQAKFKQLFHLQKLYLNSSASLDIEMDVFYSDILQMISGEKFDANIVRQIKSIRDNLYDSISVQLETIKNYWNNVINQQNEIANLQNGVESVFLATPSKLVLQNLELKFHHLCALANQIDKNIKCTTKDNITTNTYVKEATLVFIVLDSENQGYLNSSKMKSCLETLGFLSPNNFNGLSTSDPFYGMLPEMDPHGTGKVYLDNFLKFVYNKRSKIFKNRHEIIESFFDMSSGKEFISEQELKDSIGDELAEYWIKKFKKFAEQYPKMMNDEAKSYNYKEFFLNQSAV